MTVTVEEDCPDHDTLLAADLDDKLQDVAAQLREASELAAILASAASDPPNPSELRRGVARCHRLHLLASQVIRDGLLGGEQIRLIRQLARNRGGPWVPWSRAVIDGLTACREPLMAVDDALLEAWETLADRAAGTDVSVRTVGQQVRL